MPDFDADRPPLGIIVEGEGEYHAFPSIVSKLMWPGINIPRSAPCGFHSIFANLPRHLEQMAKTRRPWTIIVTIDYRDGAREKKCSTCVELKSKLEATALGWLETASETVDPNCLPERIVIVIQMSCLESWLIADLQALKHQPAFSHISTDLWDACENIDEQVKSPQNWLEKNATKRFSTKDPAVVKRLLSESNINRVREKSRSFNKFAKEIERAAERWQAEAAKLV